MKNQILYIGILLGMVFLFPSCTEEIDLDLDNDYQKLVVDAQLTNDTTKHKVVLTKSTSYFDSEPQQYVEGANVYIKNADGSINMQLTESATEPGHYYTSSNAYGVIGETYTLHIENIDINEDGDYEDYQGEEILKHVLRMDSITVEPDTLFGRPGFRIYGNGQEPPTVGDYYMWNYYINGELKTDTLHEIIFTDDGLVNGSYLSKLEMSFLTDAQSGDTLLIESLSITKEYYEFIISFMLETQWQAGPFGGPPANIKTNINNGAVGYFKASAVDRIEVILP